MVGGARWVSMAQLLVQVMRLFGGMALALIMGASEFGLLAVALLVTLFIDTTLKDLGFSAAIVQKPEEPGEDLSSLFWLNTFVGIAMTTALFIGGSPLARVLNAEGAGALLSYAGFAFGLSTPAVVHWALLRRRMNYKAVAALQLLGASITTIVPLGLALAGWGAWSVVWGGNLAALATTTLAWRLSGWRPSFRFRLDDVRPYARYSLNLSGSKIIDFATANGDRLIVTRWLGTLALGYYNFGFRMMLTPIKILNSLTVEVMMPGLSRLQDHPAELRSAFRRVITVTAVLTLPVMLTLHVVTDPIFRMLPSQWQPARTVVALLAVVGAVQGVMSPMHAVYLALGRTRLLFMWSITLAVVSITGYLLGVQHGVVGVAWGYLGALGVLFLPHMGIPAHLVGVTLRRVLGDLAPIVLAGLLLVAVGYLTVGVTGGLPAPASGVLTGLASLSTYGLAVFFLRIPALGDLVRLLPLPSPLSVRLLAWLDSNPMALTEVRAVGKG